MRHRVWSLLAIGATLLHCGAYMDVDDAPRTALQAGAPPQLTEAETPTIVRVEGSTTWPMQTDVHPAVVNMPASAETSIDAVAKYLAAREKDPLMLVKALHDWVADRIRYERQTVDTSNVGSGQWFNPTAANPITTFALSETPLEQPSADRAFLSRKGVCGDYAMLLTELAKHTGNHDIDIRYVTGYARSFAVNGDEEGYHAWNVAHVKGQAYMVDATWDAGTGEGARFQRAYRTDYLFTPPDVFAKTHYPDWDEDLHTTKPLTRQEFDSQPLFDPRFYELALKLESPPTHAHGQVELVVDNPYDVQLGVEVMPIVKAPLAPSYVTPLTCNLREGHRSVADCKLEAPGQYAVVVFARTGTTRVDEVAMVKVTRDG
jgi:transglutaminase/protease-like cytokinesis protein 3